jgi:predicted anti-sigma-YlaC factor YlaD
MHCSKTQRLFDDLSEDRLPETLSRELRRHLDECTDCRVAQQRAARLQRLLALKRYERPSPEYFSGFLGEFHQRLQAEARSQAWWWERLVAGFTIEPLRTWRYAFVGAAGAFLVVTVLLSRGIIPMGWPVASDGLQVTNDVSMPIFAEASLPPSRSTPTKAIASVLTRSVEPSSAGSVVIIPAAAHSADAEVSAPRYVLDHITVTPASYEVASIHF